MADSAKWWYEYHKEDYSQVKSRLKACRNVMLHGRKDAAIDMLEKSAVNAVLSIQTSKDRHERAFTAYYAADISLEMACGMTVYKNHKSDWLHHSLANFDFGETVDILRDSGVHAAHEKLVDDFKGLSWVKGAFTLAMLGMWELACPDTRTKQQVEYEGRIRSKEDFNHLLEMIDEKLDIEEPLFIKQWILYDYQEQEHARHMPFFREVLPNW